MKKLISTVLCSAIFLSIVPAMAAESPIINNDFESGEIGFGARGPASVELTDAQSYSGKESILVSGRGGDAWNGISKSVVNDVKLDETYNARMYVKAADPDAIFTVKITMEMQDDTGTDYIQAAAAKVNGAEWTLVEGTWTADYQGNLNALNFDIETDSDGIGQSFYVDNIFFAHSSVAKPAEVIAPIDSAYSNITYSGIVMPDDAAQTAYVTAIEKLMAMGVINGYEDGTFKPDNNVTRAEFLAMLLRLLRMDAMGGANEKYSDVPAYHWANGTIEMATDLGICDGYGDGRFGPEDSVTYAQAVKMLMSVLGYSVVAENNGGYPNGYMQAATNEDIYVKGASDINAPLTRAMTAELLSKSLDVSLYLRDGKGNYTRSNSETILTQYYDGDIDKGYISTSNDISTDDRKAGIGVVIIDGEEYRVGKTLAETLVGYNVEYIYESDDGERTLLYVGLLSSRNEEFVIDARDIESYSDYKYEYYNEKDSLKTKRISKNFTLVYNGKTLNTGFTDDLMVPEVGSVRLVGADSDYYDVVYITSYDIHVVSSVNRTMGVVYDVNNTKLDLDEDDTVFINPDGSEGTIANVRKDDILHVMATPGEDDMTVRIIRSTISGEVSALGTEDVTISDRVYDYSKSYLNKHYESPKLGTTVTAYFDINGDVVYIKDGANTNMEVAYLLNAAILDSGEDLQIKYFTSSGNVETSLVADNAKIDGIAFKSGNINTMLNVVKGYTDKTTKRIFRYNKNSGGKMSQLDFPRDQEAVTNQDEVREGKDTLHLMNGDGTTKFKYKSTVHTFFNTSNGSFAVKPDALVFSIPAAGTTYEGDYAEYEVKSTSSLWNDTDYKIMAYSVDCDTIFADYAVVYTSGPSTDSINSKEAYIVTKVYSGLNSNNEEVQYLEVYNGTTKSYALKNSEVWDSAVATNDQKAIKKGDVVRFDVDTSGQISNLSIALDDGSYDDYFFAANGYLFMKEDGYAFFTKRKPKSTSSISDSDMILIPLDSFKILVYNRRTEEAYQGVGDEIIDYKTDPDAMSQVYITMNHENALTLVCITEE